MRLAVMQPSLSRTWASFHRMSFHSTSTSTARRAPARSRVASTQSYGHPRDVIIEPVVSEKAYDGIDMLNAYTFLVDGEPFTFPGGVTPFEPPQAEFTGATVSCDGDTLAATAEGFTSASAIIFLRDTAKPSLA